MTKSGGDSGFLKFFNACEDSGECATILSPPAPFFKSFLKNFLEEISLRTLIPLFRPGSVHSVSLSWDCGQVFPDELCMSLFPDSRGVD